MTENPDLIKINSYYINLKVTEAFWNIDTIQMINNNQKQTGTNMIEQNPSLDIYTFWPKSSEEQVYLRYHWFRSLSNSLGLSMMKK